jgi:hypothetical protein
MAIGGAQAGGSPPQLAFMPLPAKTLGSQVAGLAVAADSGVVSNENAAAHASGSAKGSTLAGLGRLTGYRLDFGGGMPGAGRLFKAIGAKVVLTWFKVPGLGSGSFADDGTVSLKGVPTFAGADVDFRVGAYVGRVTIEGHTLADVRSLAVRDGHALRARMLGVLAGRDTGPAPQLPAGGQAERQS